MLEIGCSNGMRLNNIHKIFDCECYGIDPSLKAIENGKKEFSNVILQVGTADLLPFKDGEFDMIIFGWCLYLCDRKDLFRISSEADRCLSNNGFLVILDFYPPFPYKNKYIHTEGIYSYKMNYAKLFTSNPAYQEIFKTIFNHSGLSKMYLPDEKVAIIFLNKNNEFAYAFDPYQRVEI